jgi:hypothetical protein
MFSQSCKHEVNAVRLRSSWLFKVTWARGCSHCPLFVYRSRSSAPVWPTLRFQQCFFCSPPHTINVSWGGGRIYKGGKADRDGSFGGWGVWAGGIQELWTWSWKEMYTGCTREREFSGVHWSTCYLLTLSIRFSQPPWLQATITPVISGFTWADIHALSAMDAAVCLHRLACGPSEPW